MKSSKYTVNATAVKIVSAEPFTRTVYIHASSGSIYLGGPTLTTTADGLHLPNNQTLAVNVPANEAIWAIDGAGGATAVVLDSDAAD